MSDKPTSLEDKDLKAKVRKNLMWLAIITIIMLFGGLTSAYVVAMGKPNFVPVDIPFMFWISAALILISSITMNYAVSSAKKDNYKGVKSGALLTLFLGIGFTITQFSGWGQLVSQNIFMVGHPAGQYLYLLSGLHLVHLAGGLISLVVVSVKADNRAYSSHNLLGLEIASIYWHFLDALWIYLLLFLQFIR